MWQAFSAGRSAAVETTAGCGICLAGLHCGLAPREGFDAVSIADCVWPQTSTLTRWTGEDKRG